MQPLNLEQIQALLLLPAGELTPIQLGQLTDALNRRFVHDKAVSLFEISSKWSQ